MKKVILILVLVISTISLFAQKPPLIPNYPVPENPDVYSEDKDAYDMGYRLGKMYALNDDVANYKWACDNATNLRNQYAHLQAYYENQLLGIVAGWRDNRISYPNSTYLIVKNYMRQSHTYKWTIFWDTNYGFAVAKTWLP